MDFSLCLQPDGRGPVLTGVAEVEDHIGWVESPLINTQLQLGEEEACESVQPFQRLLTMRRKLLKQFARGASH